MDAPVDKALVAVRALRHCFDKGGSAQLVVLEGERMHHTHVGSEQTEHGVFPRESGARQTERDGRHGITRRRNLRIRLGSVNPS